MKRLFTTILVNKTNLRSDLTTFTQLIQPFGLYISQEANVTLARFKVVNIVYSVVGRTS